MKHIPASGRHRLPRYPSKPVCSSSIARNERGVALVVALILLVVISLVGLAAVSGTIMQQKMASNMYDRQIAFQNAEAAMRAAQLSIPTMAAGSARNCQSASQICLPNPFDDATSTIKNVSEDEYTKGDLAFSQPQYIIESMGNWQDPGSDTGFGQSANSKQKGANGGSTTAVFYRVTARSGDPAKVGDRAVVVLQAMIKQ